jgi:hypothetical protein
MTQRDSFTIGAMGVTVEESTDALTYTFLPHGAAYRPRIPLVLIVLFVGFPLALLGVTAYAYSKTANRPEWELALTALFAAQMLVWLVVGTVESVLMVRWSLQGIRTELHFAHAGVRHGADPVCPLEEVRGLRLFTYPAMRGEELGKPEACLSLVVGEDDGTHGLLGGFEEHDLRTLADDIHRRLSALRSNQGMMTPLEPLSVVATTGDEAGQLMHTRPARGARLFAVFSFVMLFNRWVGTAWCLAMLAGLFASGRLAAAAGLNAAFLLGHGLVGFTHFALLVGLWTPQNPTPTEEKTE